MRRLRAAQAIDQPVIVLSVQRRGGMPEPGRLAALRTLLNVYGWRGKVPVVVTRADVGPPLTKILDEYRASLVYQSPKGPPGCGRAVGRHRWYLPRCEEPIGLVELDMESMTGDRPWLPCTCQLHVAVFTTLHMYVSE